MSVRFWTSNPRGLLYTFEQAIYDANVNNWLQYADGLFTLSFEALRDKAFMRAKVYTDSLAFAILKGGDQPITDQTYGLFQGRLIDTFLSNFSEHFTLADVSAEFRSRDGDLIAVTDTAQRRSAGASRLAS